MRTLIVEDEPLAAGRLRAMLTRASDVEVVGVADNGLDAVRAILDLVPDLVFLDVQIPDLDGFGVLTTVRDAGVALPVVIFVTAFDQYALRAFEVHAVDYLLKPYDSTRLADALGRASERLARRELQGLSAGLAELLEEVRSARRVYLDRFVIQSAGRVYFVPAADVDWIEAAANYLEIHAGKGTHLVRSTMHGIESRLDPSRFVRINRSAIVNLQRIHELQPWFHGEYRVVLQNGTCLTLSRTFRDRLPMLLGEPLASG